jgi:hypothetical protein
MFEKKKNSKRQSVSFGADFFLEGRTSRAFRMLLDTGVEKVRLWYGIDHCIHHGTWVVPKVDSSILRLYTSTS